MNYASTSFVRIAKSLREEIENELEPIGILCRIFGRGKSDTSLSSKIISNPQKYNTNGRLIQDCIGIRVVLYFCEDIFIVDKILKSKFECDIESSAIDTPEADVFSVSRHNLIFKLPEKYFRDFPPSREALPIDRTFEVQIRTIFSEGWHEIDHDLRYKRKDDWVNANHLSRGLNGVLATLETAEWSTRKIFDDLAYMHYKSNEWDGMLHSTLRMRISSSLTEDVRAFFDDNVDAAKALFRANREKLLIALSRLTPKIPLTSDNIVFLWNRIHFKNSILYELTPKFILDTIDDAGIPHVEKDHT